LGDGIHSGDAGFISVYHFGTVSELDTFDEFWQLISAFQAQPFFGCRLNEGTLLRKGEYLHSQQKLG